VTDVREYYQVPIPRNASLEIQQAFVELNRILLYILERQHKMRGLDGLTPEFANDIDVGYKRLTNVAAAAEGSDAVRKDQVATKAATLTANRLVKTDATTDLDSVTDLTNWIAGTADRINVNDDGDGTITLTLPDVVQIVGLLLSGLTASRLVGTDASKNLTSEDLVDWVSAGDGISITDNGDGTITITVVVRAGYGIDLDANGLALKQQAHETDANTSHSITDPADAPADADALRDDLVANTIPDIESALDALGTKINNILAKLEAAEIFATT